MTDTSPGARFATVFAAHHVADHAVVGADRALSILQAFVPM